MLPGSVTFRARACAVTTAGVRVQRSVVRTLPRSDEIPFLNVALSPGRRTVSLAAPPGGSVAARVHVPSLASRFVRLLRRVRVADTWHPAEAHCPVRKEIPPHARPHSPLGKGFA